MTAIALAACAGGAMLGLLFDLLSTRWPEHEPDYARRWPDWRTLVVALVGAVAAAGLVTDHPCIVAVNEHASDPHFAPAPAEQGGGGATIVELKE